MGAVWKLEFWWTVKTLETLFVHASLSYSKTWWKLLLWANSIVTIIKLLTIGAGKVAQSLNTWAALTERTWVSLPVPTLGGSQWPLFVALDLMFSPGFCGTHTHTCTYPQEETNST